MHKTFHKVSKKFQNKKMSQVSFGKEGGRSRCPILLGTPLHSRNRLQHLIQSELERRTYITHLHAVQSRARAWASTSHGSRGCSAKLGTTLVDRQAYISQMLPLPSAASGLQLQNLCLDNGLAGSDAEAPRRNLVSFIYRMGRRSGRRAVLQRR